MQGQSKKDKSEEVMVDVCKMKKLQTYGFWDFLFRLGTVLKDIFSVEWER